MRAEEVAPDEEAGWAEEAALDKETVQAEEVMPNKEDVRAEELASEDVLRSVEVLPAEEVLPSEEVLSEEEVVSAVEVAPGGGRAGGRGRTGGGGAAGTVGYCGGAGLASFAIHSDVRLLAVAWQPGRGGRCGGGRDAYQTSRARQRRRDGGCGGRHGGAADVAAAETLAMHPAQCAVRPATAAHTPSRSHTDGAACVPRDPQ